MNRVTSAVILLAIVIAGGALVLQHYRGNQVCFEEHCFNVEVAVTEEERQKGFMFRENIGPHEGILFIYEEKGYYSFWMKNTSIPLDIIWIDENREVVHINENTPPCEEDPCPSFEPEQKAKYVLEVKGGMVKKIGLETGDKLEFNIYWY